MPLKKGSSKKVLEENFHELRQGKTYARTARKFGAKKANAQMVAIALTTADKARKSK